MAYGDVRLVKLVSGETVVGEYDEKGDCLLKVASLQVNLSTSGAQISVLPYGFPFEDKPSGKISMKNVMFEFEKCSQELIDKYIEMNSSIRIEKDLGSLQGGDSGLLL